MNWLLNHLWVSIPISIAALYLVWNLLCAGAMIALMDATSTSIKTIDGKK